MLKKNSEKCIRKIQIILRISVCLLIILGSITINIPLLKASTWTQTSDKDFKNGTLNNVSIVGNDDNAELVIDLTKLHNWTKKIPLNNPSGREDHGMASIWGVDKILLFGGFGLGTIVGNDTWEYDLSENKWSEKKQIIAPSNRFRHAMSSIYGTDKVLLFGGWDNTTASNNDETWIYSMSNSSWTQKLPVEKPDPRSDHSMAPIWGTDNILLFGGYTNFGINDETWIYNYTNNTWTLKSLTNKPGAGGRHAMASVFGDDKVVLFGGSGSVGETWIYDFSNNSWTQKIPDNNPSPRTSHAMATIWGTDKIVMFGGLYTSNKGDTWIYDVGDNKWSLITFSGNKPSARRNHAMATVYGTNKVVLFGGDSNKYLNDTWIYTHFTSTKNGTYVSYPYDTGANSTFNILSWYTDLPINTSIHLRLRSATNISLLFNRSFVGPDGKNNTYYSISPSSIWPGHNGDRFIQYIVFLNISELTDSPILKEVTITYNCIPSTIIISPINNSILNENKPNFVWAFDDFDSEQQKAFQLLIDNDLNFENIVFDTGEQQSIQQHWDFPTGTNYTIIPDGIWYWKVRTKDIDGKWSKYSPSCKFTIDTTNPTSQITIPINNGYYTEIKNISGISDDGLITSGLNKVEILIKNLGNNQFWDGQKWSYIKNWLMTIGTNNWSYDSGNVKLSSNTSYRIESRAIDKATNTEDPENYIIFTIDRESPVSLIENPKDNNWYVDILAITGTSFDIGGVGIDKVEICIKCTFDFNPWDGEPKMNYYWDGSKWINKKYWLLVKGTSQWSYETDVFNWPTGNYFNILSRAGDKLGNIEIPSQGVTFMVDNDAPDNIKIYINDNDQFTMKKEVSLSLLGMDNGSGISEMSFSDDGELWTDWEPFNDIKNYKLSLGDGEKLVYCQAKDYVGNIGMPKFDTIILDTKPPENAVIHINNNEIYTNSIVVKLNLYAKDSLSGLDDMSFSFNKENWTAWEPFNDTKTYVLTRGDGDKIIYFKIRDKAGNVAQVFDIINYDTTPPYSLSISINNGAVETKTTLVTLEVNAKDKKSGIDKISFSLDGENWDSWQNFTNKVYYELPPGNGVKTIYYQARDRAGNIAEPISASIILNTTNPKADDDKSEDLEPISFNWWIIISIVIILITIITILAILKRSTKSTEQELISSGTLTIKPGLLTTEKISIDQTSTLPPTIQLPGGGTGFTNTSGQPSMGQIAMLAKSTQTPQITLQQPQQTPVIAQLPQLPPAKIEETKTTAHSTPISTPNLETAHKSEIPSTPPSGNDITNSPLRLTHTAAKTSESKDQQNLNIHHPDSPLNEKAAVPTQPKQTSNNIDGCEKIQAELQKQVETETNQIQKLDNENNDE